MFQIINKRQARKYYQIARAAFLYARRAYGASDYYSDGIGDSVFSDNEIKKLFFIALDARRDYQSYL